MPPRFWGMLTTSGSQTASHTNRTDQTAKSTANAVQLVPVNAAVNIAVLNSGNQSNTQSNNNHARSTATNSNNTQQGSSQAQQLIG